VRQHCPETVTLVLTAHDQDAYLSKMIEAGVGGYLTKGERSERLIEAIRCAKRGESFISADMLDRALWWRAEVAERWESLSKRERQVLHFLMEGGNNASIAERLGVTTKTVDYHVANIKHKLRVSTRLEAVRWVHENIPDNLRSGF
jgi:DNA-binding NarL/FixJ family response regulator